MIARAAQTLKRAQALDLEPESTRTKEVGLETGSASFDHLRCYALASCSGRASIYLNNYHPFHAKDLYNI